MDNKKTERLYFYLEREQPTFFTNIIRWKQYGDPEIHIGAVVEKSDINNPTVLEMYLHVREQLYRTVDVHKKSKIRYFYVEVTQEQYNQFFVALRLMKGVKFDFDSLAAAGLNLGDRNAALYYCSEVLAVAMEAAKIPMFSELTPKSQLLPIHFKWSPLFIEDKELNAKLDNSRNKWTFWDRVVLFFK